MTKRQALHIAVTAGEILLQNGAEIFRVTETISRILGALGAGDHNIYVLSNGIFVTVDEQQENAGFALRVVTAAASHLGRIAAVNELSRAIAEDPGRDDYQGYLARLRACAEMPPFPHWLRVAACGVGSGAFCYLLGGWPADGLAALICGMILQMFLVRYAREGLSRFMPTILGAALVTTLAVGIARLFGTLSLDHIIIGAIISLVPGVALTTSIRDFFGGDFLSGAIHMIEALLTGACIAVGVGATLRVWQLFAEVIL